MDYFKVLPVEITLDILSRLPTETVLESKLVCTNWRNVVSHHPSFSKMHFYRLNHPSDSAIDDDSGKLGFIVWSTLYRYFWYFEYIEKYESAHIERIRRVNLNPPFHKLDFVGSCDGLICLIQFPWQIDNRVCICNPITKEYVMLHKIKSDSEFYMWVAGFGCVSSTNEYKVVRIMLEAKFNEVYIYTLGSGNGWRNIGKFYSEPGSRPQGEGIFADGALYWKCRELKMIMALDLAEEKLIEISPPPLPPGFYWGDCRLGVLEGFLSVGLKGDNGYNIWLLKKKNDNHDMKEGDEHQSLGWNKEFSVDHKSKFLAVTKSDRVLAYSGHDLNIYDTKGLSSKKLKHFKERSPQVFRHKNSLVSLKELGEEDTKQMESVEIEEMYAHECPFEQLQEDADPELLINW